MRAASLLMSGSLLIGQAAAASLDGGSVAILGYASKLVAAVLHLATLALGSAVAPYYASLAETRAAALLQRMRRHLGWVLALSVPITLALMLLSEPPTPLMFQPGLFTPPHTPTLATLQAAYF